MQDANGTANRREAQSNDGRCEMWQEANQQQFTPRLFTYSSIHISHQPYPNEIASSVGSFSFQRIIRRSHNSPDHISSHEISIHWITLFIHKIPKSIRSKKSSRCQHGFQLADKLFQRLKRQAMTCADPEAPKTFKTNTIWLFDISMENPL